MRIGRTGGRGGGNFGSTLCCPATARVTWTRWMRGAAAASAAAAAESVAMLPLFGRVLDSSEAKSWHEVRTEEVRPVQNPAKLQVGQQGQMCETALVLVLKVAASEFTLPHQTYSCFHEFTRTRTGRSQRRQEGKRSSCRSPSRPATPSSPQKVKTR